ncbi:hypothetical protein VIGAN_08256300 [Vigna angularis var. angularis]|uniref:Uncharacterized protein n=1 Tax=Vigna angularis var. angularis TaxID=157739 RepID=A0A0S3SSF2_PHAAN|nr:hypothetical protein VIGAN_08256300 [Vigna angularis var. angularis]
MFSGWGTKKKQCVLRGRGRNGFLQRASGGRCVRDVRNWYKAIWAYGWVRNDLGAERIAQKHRERESRGKGRILVLGRKAKDLHLESSSSHRRASTIGTGKERQGPEEEGEEVTGYSQLAAAIELQEVSLLLTCVVMYAYCITAFYAYSILLMLR